MKPEIEFDDISFYSVCKCGRQFAGRGAAYEERRKEEREHMATCDGTPAESAIWYLSFADGTRPKGTQFLGIVLVDALDLIDAVRQTHAAGCNPGGEVMAVRLPPFSELPADVRDEAATTYALPRLTCLSKADMVAAGCHPVSLDEMEARQTETPE